MSSVGAKGVLDLIASVESNGCDVFNSSRGETSGKASEDYWMVGRKCSGCNW